MTTNLGPDGYEVDDGAFWTGKDRDRNRRLRVDPGQTGFFAGREVRTFRELTIPNATTLVAQVIVPINVIFHAAALSIDNGSIRLSTWVGSTPSGSFSNAWPILRKNNMTEAPAYTPVVTIADGGSIAGGTQLDVIRIQTASGNSSTSAIVGSGEDSERGVGAGTYYFMFENIGAGNITGTFRAHWEERP